MEAPWAPCGPSGAPWGPYGGPMVPPGGPQRVSPIMPLFPFRVNRGLFVTMTSHYDPRTVCILRRSCHLQRAHRDLVEARFSLFQLLA